MTKWEQVYTQVLSSLVTGRQQELYDAWLIGGMDTHAASLGTIAARIADQAVKDMRLLQPSEDEQ